MIQSDDPEDHEQCSFETEIAVGRIKPFGKCVRGAGSATGSATSGSKTRENAGESQMDTTVPMERAGLGEGRAGLTGAERNSNTGWVGTANNSRLRD